MASVWNFDLRSGAGTVVAALQDAQGVGIGRELNRPVTIGGKLDHSRAEATEYQNALANGIPQLLGYRDGTLRFSGIWTPDSEEADPGGSQISFQFAEPLVALDHRFTAELYDPPGLSINDAGAILEALIDTTNTESNTLLATGSIATTVNRDVTYEYKNVGEAGRELQEFDQGFDITLTPSASTTTLATLAVVAERGSLQEECKFEHGPGTIDNCHTVRRERRYPRNRVIVVGDEGVSQVVNDTDSQSTYGIWAVVVSLSDQIDATLLTEYGQALIRPQPVEVVTFEADPDLCDFDLWDDIDVGDTAPVLVDRDAFQVDTEARLVGFGIELDDDFREVNWSISVETENL